MRALCLLLAANATWYAQRVSSQILLDAPAVARALDALAASIIARCRAERLSFDDLALVGVHTGGAHVVRRLAAAVERLLGAPLALPIGLLDITLYRDDVMNGRIPILRSTNIPFDVEDRPVILVDDVLFTGRTVRAALDAILDVGRPKHVRLAVVVDRGHRELPVAADFCALRVDTERADRVAVNLVEEGHAHDEVVLVTR
jgi:pyrimidine operon attenuation protein / uracil phosphoribosyltransferase